MVSQFNTEDKFRLMATTIATIYSVNVLTKLISLEEVDHLTFIAKELHSKSLMSTPSIGALKVSVYQSFFH